MINTLNVLEKEISALDGGQLEINSKSPKIKEIQNMFSDVNYKIIELSAFF